MLVSGALAPPEDVTHVTRGRRCPLVRAASVLRVLAPATLHVGASGGAEIVRTTTKLRCGAVTALQCNKISNSHSRLYTCNIHTSKKGAGAGLMWSGQQPNSEEAQHPRPRAPCWGCTWSVQHPCSCSPGSQLMDSRVLFPPSPPPMVLTEDVSTDFIKPTRPRPIFSPISSVNKC